MDDGLYASRFDAYTKAAEQFTASQAVLMETQTAAAQIDRVLRECVLWASGTIQKLQAL